MPHVMRSDDPMDEKGANLYFDGPVPRVGEIVDSATGNFLVKAVRWQLAWMPGNERQGPTALSAVVTVRRLHGYDRDTVERDGEGQLVPGWWKKFEKK